MFLVTRPYSGRVEILFEIVFKFLQISNRNSNHFAICIIFCDLSTRFSKNTLKKATAEKTLTEKILKQLVSIDLNKRNNCEEGDEGHLYELL